MPEDALLEARTDYYTHLARIVKVKAEQKEKEWADSRATEYHNRIYTFDGPVRSGSVQGAIAQLGMWVRRDASKPIKLIFNSPGGSVFDGLALFDFVRELRATGTKIDTVGIGMAASMGGVLLQAGETRTMTPSSYMLIHEVSDVTILAIEKVSEVKDRGKFMEELNSRLLDILAERSTLTPRQIKNRSARKDWWLSAKEALELGFIDDIR